MTHRSDLLKSFSFYRRDALTSWLTHPSNLVRSRGVPHASTAWSGKFGAKALGGENDAKNAPNARERRVCAAPRAICARRAAERRAAEWQISECQPRNWARRTERRVRPGDRRIKVHDSSVPVG